jgi:hypothetical protein
VSTPARDPQLAKLEHLAVDERRARKGIGRRARFRSTAGHVRLFPGLRSSEGGHRRHRTPGASPRFARTEHRLLAAFCKHSRRGGACSDLELAPAPDGTSSRPRRPRLAALPLKRLSPKRLLITRYAQASKRTKVSLSLPSRRDPSSTPPLKTPACGFQRAIPGACIAGVQLRFKWESSLSGNRGPRVAAQASFQNEP